MAGNVSSRIDARAREAIERHLALLPLYVAAVLLTGQLAGLLAPAGARDAAGVVKGHDFAHFYTLGTIARAGTPAALYDARALNETMWRVVPGTSADAFPPVYGPQVALAFAPLATLPYGTAVWVWLAMSLVSYLAACAIVVARVPEIAARRATAWVLLAGSPALNVLLVSGQTSAFALLALCAAWWALDRGRPLAAGACLGVLAYKPSLAAGAVAVVALAGEWRILAGLAASAAAQIGLGAAWAGLSTMQRYAGALVPTVMSAGMPASQPQHLHSLAGFWRLLLGGGAPATWLYAGTALVVVGLASWAWRRHTEARVRIAVLGLAIVLAAPHLYVYDLVLVAPSLAVLWGRAERDAPPWRRRGRVIAWLGWFAPLAGPVALATRVQWATPVLVAAFLLLGRTGPSDRQEGRQAQEPGRSD